MIKKLLLYIALITVFSIGIGSAQVIQFNTTNDDTGSLSTTSYRAQSFNVNVSDFVLSDIALKFNLSSQNIEANANITILLQGFNETTKKPDGINLSQGSILASIFSAAVQFHKVTMDQIILESGNNYSIVVLSNTTSDMIGFWLSTTVPGGYDGGNLTTSADSGASWAITSFDASFQLFSDDLLVTLNSPTDDIFSIDNPQAFNSSAFTSGLNFTNATLYIWDSDSNVFNQTTNLVTGTDNSSIWNVPDIESGVYDWNTLWCAENSTATICDWGATNRSFTFGVVGITQALVSSVSETALEDFNVTFNISSGTPTGTLWWNGTSYTSTATNTAGNQWRLDRSIDIPTGVGLKNSLWEIVINGLNLNTTVQSQTVTDTNLSLCGGNGGSVPFLNFTFKNETVAQEDVSALISESTWVYYLGSGAVNKTLSFSNASENPSYGFCAVPVDNTLNVDVSLSYDNSESEQRNYNPDPLALTNATTNTTLFLLPTSQGIFVTFQIINLAEQPLSGALVTLTRSGFNGTIAQQQTGASGTVNIFLNPNFQYTLTVELTGFSTFTTTQTFPTSEFTVQLGSSAVGAQSFFQGVTFFIRPRLGTLTNQTDTNFNYTINSSFWTLDEFGYVITDRNGVVFATNSSTSGTGGTLSSIVNTGLNETIEMRYYWVINSSYINGTFFWGVSRGTQGRLSGFFTRLSNYIDDGIFGMDNFAFMMILFFTLFLITGALSFKFGLNSPEGIAVVGLFVVALFDIGFGLIPNPLGGTITGFPTIISLLILIAIWLGRNR